MAIPHRVHRSAIASKRPRLPQTHLAPFLCIAGISAKNILSIEAGAMVRADERREIRNGESPQSNETRV